MTTLQQQARALGEPTRHAIFSRIAEANQPVSVAEINEAFQRNHNAIRQHLAKLVDADLIIESTATAGGRGRPRLVYVVNPAVQDRWSSGGPHEQLSRLLADVLTSGLAPQRVGRDAAGRFSVPPSGDAIADVSAAMARQGFEPEVKPTEREGELEMVLHNCPFASTAKGAREIVCSLHLGIAEGLTDGTEVLVDELIAKDPYQAECQLKLRIGPSPDADCRSSAKLSLRDPKA